MSLLMSVSVQGSTGQCISSGQGIYAVRSSYNIIIIIKAEGYTETEGCQLVEALLRDVTLALLGTFNSVSGTHDFRSLI